MSEAVAGMAGMFEPFSTHCLERLERLNLSFWYLSWTLAQAFSLGALGVLSSERKPPVLVRILQINRTNRICIDLHKRKFITGIDSRSYGG